MVSGRSGISAVRAASSTGGRPRTGSEHGGSADTGAVCHASGSHCDAPDLRLSDGDARNAVEPRPLVQRIG